MTNTLTVPLYRAAHGRTGDKGNRSNISVIAWDPRLWDSLVTQVTEEAVLRQFAHRRPSRGPRYGTPWWSCGSWSSGARGGPGRRACWRPRCRAGVPAVGVGLAGVGGAGRTEGPAFPCCCASGSCELRDSSLRPSPGSGQRHTSRVKGAVRLPEQR